MYSNTNISTEAHREIEMKLTTEGVEQKREADEHEADPAGGLDEPARGVKARQVDARAHRERQVENDLCGF